MKPFSPFSKPIGELTGEDLASLKSVEEGWFVDYKSEPLKPDKAAKHLSAFANQHGGWLILGVAEGDLKPTKFVGIPNAAVVQTLEWIRQGVTTHVSGQFEFHPRIIPGPVVSVGLPEGHSVVVVFVPPGEDPPYIHSSGRIFRRVGDSSEPKAETDRMVLDDLWMRSERARLRLDRFLSEEVIPLWGISGWPMGTVYYMNDLTVSDLDCGLSFKRFQETMRSESAVGWAKLVFERISPTQNGYIAATEYGNSIRWYKNGNVRMTLPVMPVMDKGPWCDDAVLHSLRGHMGTEVLDILDMEMWLLMLLSLTSYYCALRDESGIAGSPVAGKIVLSGIRGKVPFLPLACLTDQMESNGFPRLDDDSILSIPFSQDQTEVYPLNDTANGAMNLRSFDVIAPLLPLLIRALGINTEGKFAESFGLSIRESIEKIQAYHASKGRR